MKKILALVLALCLMLPAFAMADEEIRLSQVFYSAHGDKSFAIITVAMQGDKIVAAKIDELQFLGAEGVTPVPASDGGFGENYPEGKVLASKVVNNEFYSANMAKAGSTVSIADNFAAIEAFVAGKTIAEIEAEIAGKSAEQMTDVVSGSTLADTTGYVMGVLEAAKAAK